MMISRRRLLTGFYFSKSAGFINVGIYHFQVKEDVALATEVLASHEIRERPWRA